MTLTLEPTDFIRPATDKGLLKTLVLASAGGILEFYDFIAFIFFADAIGKSFFPPDVPDWVTQLRTLAIFGVGYLARPLGGIIMAHFGDRYGRKRTFLVSVFLMAVPTFLIGCLPVYADVGYAAPIMLLLLRILQGAAIGGEVPGAWVFVAEHASGARTGFACGLLASGLVGGILLGSIVSTTIRTIYPPAEIVAFAWRIPFILGGILGLVAVYLRRWLQETPVFQAIQARRRSERSLPVAIVLKTHLKAVFLSAALTCTLAAVVTVVILMAPALIQRLYGVSAIVTSYATDIATVGLAISVTVSGILVDRFGTRRVAAILFPAMIVAAYALFSRAAASPPWLLTLSLFAGLAGGLLAVVPVVMVRGFPPSVRFTGVSFSYNVAYALAGGLTPIIVQAWSLKDRFGPAHYVAICTAIGLAAALINGTTRMSSDAGGTATTGP
jgi:MFS family permease